MNYTAHATLHVSAESTESHITTAALSYITAAIRKQHNKLYKTDTRNTLRIRHS